MIAKQRKFVARTEWMDRLRVGDDASEARFRELVRLRLLREKVLSIETETDLLKDAVANLGLSLNRARGVIVDEVDGARVEIESDIDDAAGGMLSSLVANGNRVAYRDFEIVAKYYSRKAGKNIEAARESTKRLMLENSMEPKPSGLLRSTRWFRRIKV
jgi:hypothetical protein